MTTTPTRLRLAALRKRHQLGLPPDALVTAEDVLDALERHTDIGCQAADAGDARLHGAQAVLSLAEKIIFLDNSRPPPARRFDAVHEYAHLFLHSGSAQCMAADLGDAPALTTPAAVGADRVESISPRQRREDGASAYAATLLLPDDLLRRLFFIDGLSADAVAEAVGLAPSLVAAQMAEALLLPPLPEEELAEAAPAQATVTLDPFQQAAAEIARGPLLLGAGPGTGKTKTLVGRCQYLARLGVPPEQIVCLTFSRDAVKEMRQRLAQAGVTSGGAGPWVGTFHSFGLDLLKRFGARIGLSADARLLGTVDAVTLLENNLARLELDVLDNLYNPAQHLSGILRQISRAKDELCPPARYEALCQAMQIDADQKGAEWAARAGKKLKKDQDVVERAAAQAAKAQEIARCYKVYEELKAEHGFLDYGDLIYQSVQILEACPDVQAAVQAEFLHVLADEYQDVNRACALLVRLLAGPDAAGLWAVGDHRQSIYRFRGASPANVAAFGADYPSGRRLELGINYRSRTPIVQCFRAVAAALTPEAQQVEFAGWQAHRGPDTKDFGTEDLGTAVTLATAPNAESQAAGIAEQIRKLRPQYSYGQQAILCRTHAQAQDMADLLAAHDIPTLYLGDLMGRPEIKDLLCLLSLFCEKRGTALLRVGAFPEYDVPQEDNLALLRRAQEADISACDALQDPQMRQGLSAGLGCLSGHLAALQGLTNDPAALLRGYLFQCSQFLRCLAEGDADRPFLVAQKRLAIHQFYSLALAFDKRVVAPAAEDAPHRTAAFLVHLRRQAAAGESTQASVSEGADTWDAVQILTAHKAKGLEYPVVFVPNLGQGQFPGRGRSDGLPEPPGLVDTPADEADNDEFLFFVALSRARDRLILSRATTSKSGKDVPPSPLLRLLDEWLAACPEARAEWPAVQTPAQEEPPAPQAQADDLPLFPLSALETYARCPRQFWYQRELGLPGMFQTTGYPQFHACVRQALGWMEDEQAAGRTADPSALDAKLDEIWAEHGPVGHLHEAKYKAAARQMLGSAQHLQAGHAPQGRPSLIATLSGFRVSVRPDTALQRTADGARVLARRLFGRPGDDDLRDAKLALLRRAALDTFGEENFVLALHYLADGTSVEVPLPTTPYKAQLEAERLGKYERAAQGIRLRLFPATPGAADECRTCAYALICPQQQSQA